ncbi:MAG: UDP-3-O-(3-hydroxymyristoyl)glucosamine N-acyltransferase [Acidobacteriota bacterium]
MVCSMSQPESNQSCNLEQLARAIRAELIGDPRAVVHRAVPFREAREGDVTFAADKKFLAAISNCRATAIIVGSAMEAAGRNLLVALNPKLAFARALLFFHATAYKPAGVSSDLATGAGTKLGSDLSIYPRVTIGCDCEIGNRVTLHPGVVLGDRCRVGDDSIIHPNVSIYDDCYIGSRVIIHSGAVIGADGFGFVADEEGRQVKLLQRGRVIIEDDCEIGANCAIDRGMRDTILRRGVKLDNLIQVGHNCEIGEDTVVAALAGFSGGTRIGRRCVIAGQVGTSQHISVGDGAVLLGRAAVFKNVPAGARMGGAIPAQEYSVWLRAQAIYAKLPDVMDRLKKIERMIRDQRPGSQGE